MRFSYVMLPDYPLSESLETIKLADELGFYAVYAADETWHKDLWLLFAAAADKTTNIRMGPSVSAVVLREPSLIAQATATLDELTNGRAEVVLSSGNFGLLAQYGIDWTKQKPLSRVKEGVHVIRTLLDDGAITYDGEFFTYKGLFTFARPVQDRVPVKMGAMRGPKSFQVAAEFSDGCHHALSYTRGAYEYMVEHMTIGAKRAGKDVQDLDIGAWVVFATGMTQRSRRTRRGAWLGCTRRRCRTNSSNATGCPRTRWRRCSARSEPATLPAPSTPPPRRSARRSRWPGRHRSASTRSATSRPRG